MQDLPDAEHCAETARRLDPERYFAAMSSWGGGRRALLTLTAWNGELARIAPRVKEPMAGAMRLAWWREVIEGTRIPEGPLARSLTSLALPVDGLIALLDARLRDLDSRPFADMAEFEEYAEATGGNLGRLCMLALGGEGEAEKRAAAEVGTAWAMIGLLRSCLLLAEEGRPVLPGLSTAGILANDLKVREAVRSVAEKAAFRLEAGRRPVSRRLRPALLIAIPARDFLSLMHASGYDPAHPGLLSLRRTVPLRMLLAAWLGRI